VNGKEKQVRDSRPKVRKFKPEGVLIQFPSLQDGDELFIREKPRTVNVPISLTRHVINLKIYKQVAANSGEEEKVEEFEDLLILRVAYLEEEVSKDLILFNDAGLEVGRYHDGNGLIRIQGLADYPYVGHGQIEVNYLPDPNVAWGN